MKTDWFEHFARHPLRLPATALAKNGGAQVLAVLEHYRQTERLAAADLGEQQRMLLLALAQHAAAQSPNFSARLAAAALTSEGLAEPGGLARLPPLTRSQLVAAGAGLFCRSVPPGHGRTSTTTTSGSTGEPVIVRRTELCQLHWMAYTLREHLWHGRDFSGRLAVARANITELKRSADWGPPCNFLVRTGPALAIPATRSIEEILRALVEFAPHQLLIMPGLLTAIVARLEQTGQRLDGLRDLRTLSETVTTRLRADVRRVLGVEIQDSYSSQEGGVMATQCAEAGGYHVSETILLEVVDASGRPCAPGEIGRILVTDLLNFATPLIRYEIGDYAEVGSTCACGRGLPTLRRFLGRERNLVVLPDGSRHWPTVGFHHWPDVFPIRQFQFIQHDRATITARLSATGRPTPEQQDRLTQIIQTGLGHSFAIRYEWQEEPLTPGPGGKFEEFISHAS